MRAIKLILFLETLLFAGQVSPAVAQDTFFTSDDVQIRYVDRDPANRSFYFTALGEEA